MFKVNEIFPCIQGEGKTTGISSVLVRLYGCNIKCGWCDSLYAIEGKEYKEYTSKMLYEEIVQLTKGIRKNIIISGGEPCLQLRTEQGFELLNLLSSHNFTFEIETNGTIYDEELSHNFLNNIQPATLQLNISPKFFSLTNFDWKAKYLNDQLKSFLEVISFSYSYQIKFVIEHGEKRQKSILNIYQFIDYHNIPYNKVYIMTEGQTREEQLERMSEDMEFALEHGFNYSSRLQVLAYNTKRKV